MSQKGTAFERELAKLLRDNGFDVTRGAASKGKAFGIDADLIATKRSLQNDRIGVMVIIQCKVKGLTKGRGGKRPGAGRKRKYPEAGIAAAQDGPGNQIESKPAIDLSGTSDRLGTGQAA